MEKTSSPEWIRASLIRLTFFSRKKVVLCEQRLSAAWHPVEKHVPTEIWTRDAVIWRSFRLWTSLKNNSSLLRICVRRSKRDQLEEKLREKKLQQQFLWWSTRVNINWRLKTTTSKVLLDHAYVRTSQWWSSNNSSVHFSFFFLARRSD